LKYLCENGFPLDKKECIRIANYSSGAKYAECVEYLNTF